MLIVLVVAFAAGCGEDEDSVSSADEEVAVQEDTAEQETEPSEDSVASIGETVTIGDVQWTVTDAQQSDILVSRLGTEEGNFVIVDVNFVNNSNQDITLATPFVTLLDSEGREVEADIENNFIHVEPARNMFVDHVTPGTTKEGRIIYSIAPDASGFQLKVGQGKFASDETRYIDLGF